MSTAEPLTFTIRTETDGSAPMQLTVLSPGTLSIAVTAYDEEFASDQTLQVQIEVQSLFVRLLWIIGLSILSAAVALAVILLIRQSFKPAFGELQVSVAVRNADAASADCPAGFFPLQPFKKRGVSLYTLLLNFMLPPLRQPDPNDTDAMVLYPSHKGHAMLKIKTKTPVRVTPAVRLKGSRYLLNQSCIEITTDNGDGAEPANETIVLFFQTTSADPVKAASPDDALWDR